VTQAAPAQQQQQQAAAQATPLDPDRVKALETAAGQNAQDLQSRVQLGNMYFDAEQYPQAIKWYEQALALSPADTNVSTDLGVAYYYTNQPDRALAQFDKSLAVDPKHIKTLLNVGIVKAFGKQDFAGAANAWQKVVDLAPESPEGQAAKKGLDGIRSAHPEIGGK
jgi:cytochrome c-type biogenesis protein CcmH/NrfG